MNVKHGIGLSWVHESMDVETKRPCARLRDAEREAFAVRASGDPAKVLMFRMASILPMVRASNPLRPAAGLLLDTPRGCFEDPRVTKHDLIGKPEKPPFRIMRKRARDARVMDLTANVVLFEQSLVARLVLPLDVIKQGTARCDHFQKAPARMIVLHVGFEMPGEVIDAFRKDRDLNLRRAGVAGLVGIRLDDFRFAFCGNRHRQTLSLLRAELAVSPVRLNTRLGMSSPLPISARAKSRPATVT